MGSSLVRVKVFWKEVDVRRVIETVNMELSKSVDEMSNRRNEHFEGHLKLRDDKEER